MGIKLKCLNFEEILINQGRMGFCSQFKALFKKNLILWYRSLVGSICELLFPVILILLVVIVRNLVSNQDFQTQSYIFQPGGSYYYNQTVTMSPNATSNISTMNSGLFPGSAFSICLMYKRTIIAFVGSSKLYPGLRNDLFGPTGCNRIF